MTLPHAIQPFVDFVGLLRTHGFVVSPDQTEGFIAAIGVLGPTSMTDINRAARAMLAIPHEREAEFDALFRAFFLGQAVSAATTTSDEDDDVDAFEPTGDEGQETDLPDDESEFGSEAATVERLGQRRFDAREITSALQRFSRLAPTTLPRRRSYRKTTARRGKSINMRKTLRDAVKRDGEIFTLSRMRRKTRQRPIVLLIDVSGSMSDQSDDIFRFAHALMHAADKSEAFTLGTRLTRITSALGAQQQDKALARVSELVADFDGGTRLGDALQAFLAVPRFAGIARGATILMLSDGLERGSPHAMIDAVRRLSRIAWRLDWLSPLVSAPDYTPETEAMAAVRPYLDSLANGSDVNAICEHILKLARAA